MNKQYITEKELSEMTGRALQTLRVDRVKGRGFPYVKIGNSVRYDQEEVIAIIEKNKVRTSSFLNESNAILKNKGSRHDAKGEKNSEYN